jgi:hypothetical protein
MVSSEIEQFRFAVKVSRNSGKAAQNVGETWDLFVERILNLKKTRPDMAVGVRSHLNRFFDLHCGCPLHCQSDVRIRRSRSCLEAPYQSWDWEVADRRSRDNPCASGPGTNHAGAYGAARPSCARCADLARAAHVDSRDAVAVAALGVACAHFQHQPLVLNRPWRHRPLASSVESRT